MKKKIAFLNKIKNIKSIPDFLLKVNHFVNLLLTFPKGGYARYTVDLFMKNNELWEQALNAKSNEDIVEL